MRWEDKLRGHGAVNYFVSHKQKADTGVQTAYRQRHAPNVLRAPLPRRENEGALVGHSLWLSSGRQVALCPSSEKKEGGAVGHIPLIHVLSTNAIRDAFF